MSNMDGSDAVQSALSGNEFCEDPHIELVLSATCEMYSPWGAIAGLVHTGYALDSTAWKPGNESQRQWQDSTFKRSAPQVMRGFKHLELCVCSGSSSDEISDALQRREVREVRLDYWLGSTGHVGFCSVLDVTPKWSGQSVQAKLGEEGRSAVFLGRDCKPRFYDLGDGADPVVVIPTENDMKVYIWPQSQVPLVNLRERLLGLGALVKQQQSVATETTKYAAIVVPEVVLNQTTDLSELEGFQTVDAFDGSRTLVSATSHIRFRLTHTPSPCEWSFGGSGVAEDKRETLVVDKPFIVMIERPSLKVPILVGVFGYWT